MGQSRSQRIKYIETNEKKTTMVQNLWEATKVVIGGIWQYKHTLRSKKKNSNKQPNVNI